MSSNDRTLGGETRQWGEHQRERAEREHQQYRQTLVRETLREGNRAIVAGEPATVAVLLRDRLLPALDVSPDDLYAYDETLAGSYLAWEWDAIVRFMDAPDRYVTAAFEPQQAAAGTHWTRFQARGYTPPAEVVHRTVFWAFLSAESIAVAQGFVPGTLAQSSTVYGHELQLGIKWQAWDYETPDEVSIVNSDIHPPFHIALGTPGYGKTTSLDTLVEDAYAAGVKIVDLLDFSELENGMYDVKSQREELIERRRDLGEPGTWDDHDEYERPDLEILHPLCSGLCESALPFDTDAGEFSVRPFTIPPAEVDHDSLVAQFPHLSEVREKTLREALEALSDRDDWRLADLRDEILDSSADQGVKDRLESAIRTVDKRGFIRARSESEHGIDWPRIFDDTDTITVFSMALMEQEAHKLMVTGYLLDAIYEERYPDNPEVDEHGNPVESTDYPRALAVMREMQDAAPGQRKRQSAQGAKRALYQYLLSRMQLLGEKRRHTDLGIIGDTQQWRQIAAGVRENVDRVLMFKNQPGTARKAFNQLTGSDQREYLSTVDDFDIGDCCAIGSGHISTGQSFLMPIAFSPPMCHHLDTDDEAVSDGWHARAAYLDHEELRESPYTLDAGSVPEAGSQESKYDRTPETFHAFVDECIAEDESSGLIKTWAFQAYLAFADDCGGKLIDNKNTFGVWMREFFPTDEYGNTRRSDGEGNRPNAYNNLRLTTRGEEFYEKGAGREPEDYV